MEERMVDANLIKQIKESLELFKGKWGEKKGLWDFSVVIAERKTFLSKKKLTYSLKLRVDDAAKMIKFSEMLTETGSGFSSGGDMDSGFGVKTESYNTFSGARSGTIQEQSTQFGKDYSYTFDYAEIRNKVQTLTEQAGYKFEYQVLPVK
jgi:hypothetical protein